MIEQWPDMPKEVELRELMWTHCETANCHVGVYYWEGEVPGKYCTNCSFKRDHPDKAMC